jgi:hypothetical protein
VFSTERVLLDASKSSYNVTHRRVFYDREAAINS